MEKSSDARARNNSARVTNLQEWHTEGSDDVGTRPENTTPSGAKNCLKSHISSSCSTTSAPS